MKKYQTAWIGLLSVLAIAGAIGVAKAGTTNTVLVRGSMIQPGFYFNPSNIVIACGDTILWTNTATTSHDVTHGSRAGGINPTPYWAKINFTGVGNRSAVTFSNLGSYPYVCVQHVLTTPQPPGNPTQTGLVTVAFCNLPPTASITAPTNLTRFAAPASFTITADAADPDPDGSVSNVQFFAGTTLLGTDDSAPYSFDVSNLAAGWYPLTARATDNLGGSSISAVVNVLVNSNRTVEVVGTSFSPNLLSVTVGDTVTFNGLAFFHTATGTGTVEPFCGSASLDSCSVTFNVVGTFPFHCIPHQSFGMTGSVQVVGPNLRPFAQITSPASGSVFATGATFTVSADASDLFGRVNSVRFLRNGANLMLDVDSPYSANVNIQFPGNYLLTALVTDNSLLTSTSAAINISVVAPVNIQLLSPAAGAGGFLFDYTANPGLTYVIEGSEADGSPTPFVPLATNVANTNLMTFTDSTSGGRSNRAYRVFRRP